MYFDIKADFGVYSFSYTKKLRLLFIYYVHIHVHMYICISTCIYWCPFAHMYIHISILQACPFREFARSRIFCAQAKKAKLCWLYLGNLCLGQHEFVLGRMDFVLARLAIKVVHALEQLARKTMAFSCLWACPISYVQALC